MKRRGMSALEARIDPRGRSSGYHAVPRGASRQHRSWSVGARLCAPEKTHKGEAGFLSSGGTQHSRTEGARRGIGAGHRRWIGRAALVVVLGLAHPENAFAQQRPLYRHVDENGVIHFTNVPSSGDYKRVYIKPQGLVSGRGHLRRPPRVSRYDTLIARAAMAYRLEPALVKAVIAAESNFDPSARSHKGAQGLMQLMPKTASLMGVEDAYRPEENVLGGSRYLREMLTRYDDDVKWALAAYNAGPTAVERYGGIPPYEETQKYVERVLHYYRGYHRDFRR